MGEIVRGGTHSNVNYCDGKPFICGKKCMYVTGDSNDS